MKILIVSLLFPPEVGAAPTRLHNMAKGLIERGVEVDVLTAMPNYPTGRIFDGYRGKFSMKEEMDGMNIYRYWVFASNSKNMWHRLMDMISFAVTTWAFAFKRKLIKSYDCVIIQSPHLLPAGSAAKLFKSLYGKKVIINISDIHPDSSLEIGRFTEKSRKFKVLKSVRDKMYKRADGFMGQSNEITEHVKKVMGEKANTFLYRNLQRANIGDGELSPRHNPMKIVYAGLLSPTQGVKDILDNVDFDKLGVEFHIYGAGADAPAIEEGIANGKYKSVVYHGMVSKKEVDAVLGEYDASIVPLNFNITGAVPSKIFDLIKTGIPVLFSGAYAEAAKIIEENKIGLTSLARDYDALSDNIKKMKEMSNEEYIAMKENMRAAARDKFNFDKQFDGLMAWLEKLCK